MIDDLIEFYRYKNIAAELDLDLAKIGEDIVKGYDMDLQSREPWEGEMKEATKLALQVMEKKDHPWPNASNVKMPLLTEAMIHFNSEMNSALVPPGDIVKGKTVGFDPKGEKQDSAVRVSKFMSHQMHEDMEEWEEEMDIGLIVLPLMGNMYKKTYYDFDKARPCSKMLMPKQFVFDYNATCLEEAFRKTHVIPMTANDIRKEVLAGNYLDTELPKPVQKDKEKEGETAPQMDDSTPYDILECHTLLDLDEDGLMEPYIVTVNRDSKTVLRITSGYDPAKIRAKEDGTIIDVPQLQYFTKYGFVPNPDGGSLDLGLGKLLGPTNHAVNTLINQLIDAGTKDNMGGGFIGRGLRVRGGKLKFTMGEYKRVDSSGQEIAKNIYTIPTNGPSPVLFQLLGLLINSGQRLSSTLDSQVGENPGQNQKATTTQIVEANGRKIFNGIYKRCHRSLKKEIKKIFYWNSKYLKPEEYENVLDTEDARQFLPIDFSISSKNLIPAADPQYTSQQQKLLKAQALLQKIPTGLVNPQVAMQRVLEAEEQPDIEQIMNVGQPRPSIDELKLMHQKQIDWANIEAEAIRLEQEEVKIYANAILALAKAESEEEGRQLETYKTELKAIVDHSRNRQQRATALRSSGSAQ